MTIRHAISKKTRTAAALIALAAAALALTACGNNVALDDFDTLSTDVANLETKLETIETDLAELNESVMLLAELSGRALSQGAELTHRRIVEYSNTTASVPPIQASGGGFLANETVILEIPGHSDNPIATSTANAFGGVHFAQAQLPNTIPPIEEPIVYTIRATGQISRIIAISSVDVTDEFHD